MADKKIRLLVSAEVNDAISKLNKTERSSNKLQLSFKSLIKRVGMLAGAAGLGALVKSSVQTSAQFEALETRLVALKGSAAAGAQAFDHFNKIAAGTPFQLANVVEAGAQLEAFGADSEETLKAVADLAAFMGVDVVEAANAFGRAFAGGAGAADVLRERGVLTQIKLASGFDDLSKLTLPEFREAMINTLTDPDGNISGATDLLAATFSGLVSNFQDSLSRLQDSIGDLLAPAIKEVIKNLKGLVDGLTEQFKRLGESDLETTIRLVKELGGDFEQLAIAQAKIEIANIDEALGGKDSEKVLDNISEIQQQILDEANRRAKVQQSILDLENKENVMQTTGMALHQQILDTLNAELDGSDKLLNHLKEKLGLEQEDLLLLKERKDLTEQITNLEKPDPSDDGAAVTLTQEEIKTQILKSAAEKRKQIQAEEKMASLSMEEFELAVSLLKTTEEQKTKIIQDEIKRRQKAENDAHKKRIEQNLEAAILQGQSAKQAAISVIKAEIAESQASLISSIMQSVPFPLNLALAAGAGSMIGKVTDQLFSSFATGGSFVARGKTTLPIGNGIIVGDNASGLERVDITPLPAAPSSSGRNITINISAPLVDETVVDHIIPAIKRAEELSL